MKKKFLSILIALVLVCSFSLVTAVPVAASPDVSLQFDGHGIAEWSCAQQYPGTSSVDLEIPAGYAPGDAARVATPYTGDLNSITSLSYYFYVGATTPPTASLYDGYIKGNATVEPSGGGMAAAYGGPYLIIELDADGNEAKDTWVIQAQFASTSNAGWQLDTIALGVSPFHVATMLGASPFPMGTEWGSLTEVKAASVDGHNLGTAAVLNVKVAVGEWDPAQGPTGPVVNFIDSLEINATTSDLELPAARPLTVDDDRVQNTVAYFQRIQSAIDCASDNDTISVAAGTYDLTAPIVVDESVTLTGDTTTPSNVVVNAPTGGVDMDCFQVKANNVTIQGFLIQGALDAASGAGAQNAGVMIGTHWVGEAIKGLHTIDISHNEFVDCSKGIFMYHVKDSTVSYNHFTTTEGETIDNFTDTKGWGGDAVHVYLWDESDYPTGNTISHNNMDNVRVGVFLNADHISGTDPSAWDFSGTTIEDNIMTDVWNVGIVLQCASGTVASPIIINMNDINTSTGRRAGDEGNERGLISVRGDYTVVTGNTLTNSEEHGLWVDGSHHIVEGNIVTSNTKDGIHVGAYKEVEPINGWTLPVITRADIAIQANTVENVGADAAAIFAEFTDSIAILDNPISNFVKGGIVVKDVLLVQIEGNIISNTSVAEASNGIQIGWLILDPFEIDLTPTTGTIKGNQVSGCHWEGYDPLTETYEVDWTASGILIVAPNSALEISGNEVQSCDVGLDIETGLGTSIEDNDVHGNSYGFVSYNADPTINFNNIYQNALGGVYRTTQVEQVGILDAENNWWGQSSGPAEGAVDGNVDAEPWLLTVEGLTDENLRYDKTLALNSGWSIVSPDEELADWDVEDLDGLMLTYGTDPVTGDRGFIEVAGLNPVTPVFLKTADGGGIGFNYAPDSMGMFSTDLEAGWNLIGIPRTNATTGAILSPLRYGSNNEVALATLANQGNYNPSDIPSFYESTLGGFSEIPGALGAFDGYWAYMNVAKEFGVVVVE